MGLLANLAIRVTSNSSSAMSSSHIAAVSATSQSGTNGRLEKGGGAPGFPGMKPYARFEWPLRKSCNPARHLYPQSRKRDLREHAGDIPSMANDRL